MRERLAVLGSAFAVLAWGVSPAWFWLDSGELAAAGADLGVMHPPGTPGYALLLRAAMLVPLGTLGFRMALLSSALVAASIALGYTILRRRGVDTWLAAAAAAWWLGGWTLLRQGRVVEIYALALACTMVAIWGLDPELARERRISRRLLATGASVIAAWSFGDLRIALFVVVIVVAARERRDPWVLWAPLVTAWSSLVVLALPLASARGVGADWGDPEVFVRLWDHLQAASIREAYAEEILPASPGLWWQAFGDTLGRVAEDLGPLGPMLGLAGVAAGLWFKAARRGGGDLLAWLVGIELFYAVGVNPMGGADRQTGLVVALALGLAATLALHRGTLRLGRARWAAAGVGLCLLAVPTWWVGLRDTAVTRSWSPHVWTREALAQLPPRALLLVQSDDLAAGVSAARALEFDRPDVVWAPIQHLHKRPPDRFRGGVDEARLWAASEAAHGERGRVLAVLATWPGVVAVEGPRAGLLASVPWWSDFGAAPLALAGPGVDGGRVPRPDLSTTVAHWRTRLETVTDRVRLARALAGRAQAVLGVAGAAGAVEAEATYTTILRELVPDHASTLIALGALYDREFRRDAAIALTRRALEIDPTRMVGMTNLALYLSREAGTAAEALAWAERASALWPGRAEPWARLAQVRAAAGDAPGAERAAIRAAALAGAEPSPPQPVSAPAGVP